MDSEKGLREILSLCEVKGVDPKGEEKGKFPPLCTKESPYEEKYCKKPNDCKISGECPPEATHNVCGS